MSDIAQLTQGEQDAALVRVSGSARFSKMMEECESDELGVRVQKQSELANRMMKESLSMLVKKIAVKHCRNAMEEVRKLKQVNLQLIEENRQLRKAAKDPVAAARRQIQKEVKHKSNNELRRRDMARKRAFVCLFVCYSNPNMYTSKQINARYISLYNYLYW